MQRPVLLGLYGTSLFALLISSPANRRLHRVLQVHKRWLEVKDMPSGVCFISDYPQVLRALSLRLDSRVRVSTTEMGATTEVRPVTQSSVRVREGCTFFFHAVGRHQPREANVMEITRGLYLNGSKPMTEVYDLSEDAPETTVPNDVIVIDD